MVEASAVQALNAIGGEQITVGDHARNDRVGANVGDDVIEFGMQQRLAATESDDRRAETRQFVDAALHRFRRNRLGEVVELVAISTGEIAASNGDDMRQHWVVG